jgi:tetratricopeptide (TPR) repeat protein
MSVSALLAQSHDRHADDQHQHEAALQVEADAEPTGKVSRSRPTEDTEADASTKRNEELANYFWLKADAAFEKGDYDRAIALYKAVMAIEPDNVQAYSNAAWLTWSVGRGEEATAMLQRGTQANPKTGKCGKPLATKPCFKNSGRNRERLTSKLQP